MKVKTTITSTVLPALRLRTTRNARGTCPVEKLKAVIAESQGLHNIFLGHISLSSSERKHNEFVTEFEPRMSQLRHVKSHLNNPPNHKIHSLKYDVPGKRLAAEHIGEHMTPSKEPGIPKKRQGICFQRPCWVTSRRRIRNKRGRAKTNKNKTNELLKVSQQQNRSWDSTQRCTVRTAFRLQQRAKEVTTG